MRSVRALVVGVSAILSVNCNGSSEPTETVSSPTGGNPIATPTPSAANRVPTVRIFAVEPARGRVARVTQVAFAAEANDTDGDSISYKWDFNDGNVQTGGAGVSHVFEKPDTFDVTLTVDDGRGGTAVAREAVTIGSVSGTWVGITTNGPSGGIRFRGNVVQTGRRFDAHMTVHNGDGTGDDHIMEVSGVLGDPREMSFSVTGLCGDGSTLVYRGAWDESLLAYTGESQGCGLFFRRIELFR